MNKELNNIRVLQVTAALDQGGVERGTVEMAKYINQQGGTSFVASHSGRLVPQLEQEGSTHYTLPLSYRNPFAILYSSFKLAKYAKENRIDIIHTRSRAPAWAAKLASKLSGIPMITTFHGTHKIQNAAKKLYNSSMVRGERVIAISQFIKDHVNKNYGIPLERIDIAHRGFDVERFNYDAITEDDIQTFRKKWGVENAFVITLLGRLTRWKGQELFIDALNQIKDNPEWKALIVGGAGKKAYYEEELKTKVKEFGLEDRIIFTGSQNDTPLIYKASDIVVSASIEPEAFGRVAVEGQSMKKPVIATKHGGALETVKHSETGYLVSPTDASDMAKMLRKTLEDKDQNAIMGDKGYEWVHNNFTVDAMCASEWESYKKVLY